MRLVLEPGDWARARLHDDPEARDWLARLERDNRDSVVCCELVAEGTVRYHQHLKAPWTIDVRYSPCTCVPRIRCAERDDGVLTVRRRYTGPVPPQVLAAFEPTEELVS